MQLSAQRIVWKIERKANETEMENGVSKNNIERDDRSQSKAAASCGEGSRDQNGRTEENAAHHQ